MDTFYVVTNYQKDPEFRTAKFIRTYLEQQGKTCYIHPISSRKIPEKYQEPYQDKQQEQYQALHPEPDGRQKQDGRRDMEEDRRQDRYKYTDSQCIPDTVECVLVLGGDGTLLQAARDLVNRAIPLLGINMGTLGYLAEIEHTSIVPALDRLIADDYLIEERMMLCGVAWHQSRKLLQDVALNDIVITRNGKLRVVDFDIYVDGVFLTSYSADGILVSTPTGSTGYNLSVGGPIVAPQASLLLLTAIAPHTLNSRPIVLPEEVEITIEIGNSHGMDAQGAEATFDGDTAVRLSAGDRVAIRKSEQKVKLIKTRNTSFLEVLREKMK